MNYFSHEIWICFPEVIQKFILFMGYYDDLKVNPTGLCLELNLYNKNFYNLHLFYHTAPIWHSPAIYELALMAINSKYRFYYKI